MPNTPPIRLSNLLQEAVLRGNFEALAKYFEQNQQLAGFKHVEFEVTQNESNIKISHGLGYVPRDLIITHLVAPSGAKLTANYGKFSSDQLDFTVSGLSGTLKCRAFVGTFSGSQPTLAQAETDTQEFKSKL